MSEAELVQAVTEYATAAMTAISIYLTIVSAFLVASFVAGSKLSRNQLFIVGVLFVSSAAFFTYVSVGCILRQVYYATLLVQVAPGSPIYVNRFTALCIGVIQTLGIFASLKFLLDLRRPKPA